MSQAQLWNSSGHHIACDSCGDGGSFHRIGVVVARFCSVPEWDRGWGEYRLASAHADSIGLTLLVNAHMSRVSEHWSVHMSVPILVHAFSGKQAHGNLWLFDTDIVRSSCLLDSKSCSLAFTVHNPLLST